LLKSLDNVHGFFRDLGRASINIDASHS
jgi:hypothetical protein